LILKDISEAKAELSALIEAVSKGEEVLIGKAGVPVAKLVRYTGRATKRMPGALTGKITILDGFDELPPDIAAAFRHRAMTLQRSVRPLAHRASSDRKIHPLDPRPGHQPVRCNYMLA
jgi:prevent-host-death family protein